MIEGPQQPSAGGRLPGGQSPAANESSDADQFHAGQAAFWTATPYDPAASGMWRSGWTRAANEAARTLAEHRPIVQNAARVRQLARETHPVLRQLLDQPEHLNEHSSQTISRLLGEYATLLVDLGELPLASAGGRLKNTNFRGPREGGTREARGGPAGSQFKKGRPA